MIRNYLTIAWRKMSRNKSFTVINITGLAVGIAACLLLCTIVAYELSYDRFQENYTRINRVVTKEDYPDGRLYKPGIPFPALEAFRVAFPRIQTGALFASYGSQVTVPGSRTTTGKKFIEETGVFFCDPQFFQVFHYNWLAGSPAALGQPNSTVLTRTMAAKYFGDWKTAIGEVVTLDNTITVKVNGILEDVPDNTDFPLGIVTSFLTVKANEKKYKYANDWGSTTSDFQLFMLLPPEVSVNEADRLLAQFSSSHYKGEEMHNKTHFLQPLASHHFDTRFGNFGDHVTSPAALWTLSLIGVFIIIMACINFINLSTAQAVGRSKEVGIRKVLGGSRLQLFGQVMGETVVIILIAMVFAAVLAGLCLPYVKHISSIRENLHLFNLQTMLFLSGILVVVTLLAGLYPALIVSGFQPALALKNKLTSASIGGISVRRGLVVTQFAISQVLIIGTIVAVSQMNYIRTADLGFNKEALFVINVNADSAVHARQNAFKQKLLQISGVQSVSFSSDVPSSDNNWSGNFAIDHRPDEKFDIFQKAGDEDYFKTYGLKLVAGNGYERSDTANGIVVNETLVQKAGFKKPADIIGKELRRGRGQWIPIVGVVKDFKTNSLREDIKPLMIMERKDRYSVTGIKIRSANLKGTQAAVEAIWNQHFPEYAYTSAYMNENIENFYRQENQLSLLYKIFAGIAIFISCLGLYGLVSFMAVQRTKEIGVRKVLGASAQNIMYLFSKEFTLLIFIGFVIAAPVAYFIMNHWLQDFVFRIHITAGIFLLAILASITIAWITVGYESAKAALANPVKSLRTE